MYDIMGRFYQESSIYSNTVTKTKEKTAKNLQGRALVVLLQMLQSVVLAPRPRHSFNY